MIDILFVHPGGSNIIYQELGDRFSAIEPPTWALLIAESCRQEGITVAILDCDAERLPDKQAIERIGKIDPKLIVFAVYGQNPNAGTTKMTGAVSLAQAIKDSGGPKIMFVGSHSSAMPEQVLGHKPIDFVAYNEGVQAVKDVFHHVSGTKFTCASEIPGIGWKDSKNNSHINPGATLVTDLDKVLPNYAWDLLPKKNKPLDLYRSCNWHADFIDAKRTPYAAIYTSLGCQFKCNFCMINSVNRTTVGDYDASMSNGMRFWSPDKAFEWVKNLYEMGVTTIRFSDEMFFLNRKYFEPFLQKLADSGIGQHLQIWAYARVDTVRSKYLDLFRNAGIKWLALGIESANTAIRREVTKGTFEETNIRDIVKQIREHGISVIANYIFGLPDDTYDTMNQTLDLAVELNTEMANMYCAAALPGSPLHREAVKEGWELPNSYEAWSFHSYECQPLPTKYLKAAEVLKFRDRAWDMYFNNPDYLKVVNDKFGPDAAEHIRDMAKIKLKRKLLGD